MKHIFYLMIREKIGYVMVGQAVVANFPIEEFRLIASTVEFIPLTVEPKYKLTTTWGSIKKVR